MILLKARSPKVNTLYNVATFLVSLINITKVTNLSKLLFVLCENDPRFILSPIQTGYFALDVRVLNLNSKSRTAT